MWSPCGRDRGAPKGGMSAPNNLGTPNGGESTHNDCGPRIDGVTLNCGGCVGDNLAQRRLVSYSISFHFVTCNVII